MKTSKNDLSNPNPVDLKFHLLSAFKNRIGILQKNKFSLMNIRVDRKITFVEIILGLMIFVEFDYFKELKT
jgi:hypothetical protein